MKTLTSLLIGIILVIFIVSEETCEGSKVDTTQRLAKLRTKMEELGYDAVIIPTDDEHQSEYVSEYDKRRQWISGFSGSAGTAVVLKAKAALWSDSRYYLQAEAQLDDNWIFVRASDSGSISINNWLKQELNNNSKVALNAKFTAITTWTSRKNDLLTSKNIELVNMETDIIDLVWTEGRPEKPLTPIKIHDVKFAGKTMTEKINLIKERIVKESADMFVVTALDEVAWLFNLRASDLPYNPMFFAYAIIKRDGDRHDLFIETSRITPQLEQHLVNIDVKNYVEITQHIAEYANENKKIWISPMSSFAIYSAVPNEKNIISKPSPVRSIKARKNSVELENLRKCYLRDSVARVRHMHWLETEMKKGSVITEMTAADKLEEIQEEDSLFATLSFDSISAVGPNAAVVHYSTLEGDNSTLTRNKIYLLDAGAQYEDCTTDVTRTHHYGNPTFKEKYAYTKVLQGSIDLANVVFPPGVYGRELDVQARAALWRSGLDYGHGTGHGIGYYLSVHEAPPGISVGSSDTYAETFEPGMISSDEPGYYEDGEFGIRLETDIETVEAKTQYQYNGRKYLKFESLTWVPFEKNLIDECLLTNEQVDWLNKYNTVIRDRVGPLLTREVRDYLMTKTEPFKYSFTYPYCKNYFPIPDNSARPLSGRVSFGSVSLASISVLLFSRLF